jgi:hypothetical protein
MCLVENEASKRLVTNELLIDNVVLLTRLCGEPLQLALIALLLALRSNYGKYNLYINKSSLLTSLLEDFAGLISRMVMFVKALKLSAILVSYTLYLKRLVANEISGRRSNAPMPVGASKSISLIRSKNSLLTSF